MRSCNSYQEIKEPEDYEYEECVNACFEELCDMYADEIEEKGMNSYQRANLMTRARKMAKDRMREE